MNTASNLRGSTSHKLPSSVSTRIQQDDVKAIETAFSHFKTWYDLGAKDGPVDALTNMSDVMSLQDVTQNDIPAYAFVAAKYGFDIHGEPLKGVTPDPLWLEAIKEGMPTA